MTLPFVIKEAVEAHANTHNRWDWEYGLRVDDQLYPSGVILPPSVRFGDDGDTILRGTSAIAIGDAERIHADRVRLLDSVAYRNIHGKRRKYLTLLVARRYDEGEDAHEGVFRNAVVVAQWPTESQMKATLLETAQQAADATPGLRRLREPTPTVSLTFSSGGDALYRGQWDGWIVAYDKTGRQLGRLDWQSWGQPGADKPSFLIKLIEVLPEYRRRGVATALYRELFRQEGITERDLAPATQSPEGTAFRRGARLGPPQFVLTHDGREVMRGSEDQIWTWLHRNHSYSVDWALKYEGYAIVSVVR